MSYIKKILVLKQVTEGFSLTGKSVNGIARAESENGKTRLFLSLINIASVAEGEFTVFVCDGNLKIFSYPLGKSPFGATIDLPNDFLLNKGFSCGICYENGNIFYLIAYACSQEIAFSAKDFTAFVKPAQPPAVVAQTVVSDEPIVENEPVVANEPIVVDEPMLNETDVKTSEMSEAVYDDETVATENYYEKELPNGNDVISAIAEKAEINDEIFCDKTVISVETDKDNQTETEISFGFFTDETVGSAYKSDERTYYEKMKEEIDNIFEKYPEEPSLKNAIAFSRWARIRFDDEKYYVVGLIEENASVKYICYGVPSAYSDAPPKELNGFCSFVPISLFEMKGDGYWMMFQSAQTGECVKMVNAE